MVERYPLIERIGVADRRTYPMGDDYRGQACTSSQTDR